MTTEAEVCNNNLMLEVNEFNFQDCLKLQAKTDEKIEQFKAIEFLNLDDNEFIKRCAVLFEDPTIWAYATLRDRQNQRLHLYYWQDTFINDQNRFIHCTAANQIGKTWGISVKAIHHAVHTPNASVIIISKSDKQATMILDEIKWMMMRGSIDFEELIGDVENRQELHIKSPLGGVSVIRCFPPTTGILGFPATLMLLDEIDFWEMKQCELSPIEFYDQVIEPRTNTTKSFKHPFLKMGQIVSITNPNGKQGLAWQFYSGDRRFHNYKFCWLANPNNTYEEYKYHESRLPPYRFASVYAAEYVDASGGFISLDQFNRFAAYNVSLSIPPGILYLGGDFASEDPKGKHTDFNTLYGLVQVPNERYPSFPRLRLAYAHEWEPGTKKEVIYDEIARIKGLNGVTIAKFAYDRIGVGDKVKNDLMDRGILTEHQIDVLTHSLPNKTEVYVNLQSLFEQDMIEGAEVPKLREQTLALQVEAVPGSLNLKIHHATHGIKDDHPDALANACFVARRPGYMPTSAFFVKHNKPADIPQRPKGCQHFNLFHDAEGELRCSKCKRLV